MQRRGIVCGGCVVVDLNKVIDRFPPQDHNAEILSEAAASGGPGLNMAVNLARLGATFPIEVAALIGDDAHGRLLTGICRKHGIDTRMIGVHPSEPTSYSEVMIVKETGRRTFFYRKGANALLEKEQFDIGMSNARILHVGAPGIHDLMDSTLPGGGNGWTFVLEHALSLGMQTNMEMVSIDGATMRRLTMPCLPLLDYTIINDVEAGALTGFNAVTDGEIDWAVAEKAAAALIELGVKQLAVIHFPQGCVAAGRDGGPWRQPSCTVPPATIRSANGAGDAIASGIMLGLHDGWPVPESLLLGVCVAAASLRDYSTSGGIENAQACLTFGRSLGFRS